MIYKQPALQEQIAKQLAELKHYSLHFLLRNNRKYRLRKSVSVCNKCKIAVKWTIHHNSAVSKTLLGKF